MKLLMENDEAVMATAVIMRQRFLARKESEGKKVRKCECQRGRESVRVYVKE